ncbi:hypothetical protein ABZ690_15285 [Streptomyces sp. NPDC006967]|nr:hypothetical protein [Streptomyces sp. SM1]
MVDATTTQATGSGQYSALLRTCADHRYYRRDEVRIAEVAHMFDKGW